MCLTNLLTYSQGERLHNQPTTGFEHEQLST